MTPNPRIDHERHHLKQFRIDEIPGASVINYWRRRCCLFAGGPDTSPQYRRVERRRLWGRLVSCSR